MEDLIAQNLGNISLAGALVLIAFIMRPWLMQRESNASEQDQREFELARERLEIERKTATALTGLTNQMESNRAISNLQISSMETLVDRVNHMTSELPENFKEIKAKIDGLPAQVWKTGDPKLKNMVDNLKTCLDSSDVNDQILSLLNKILNHLEKESESKKDAESNDH
jgi:hypothetical protein